MYQAICKECGKSYDAKRKTSRYCSDKCRVYANRAEYPEGTIDRDAYTILDSLEAIMALSPEHLNNKRNKALIARIIEKAAKLQGLTSDLQQSE